MKNFRLLEAAAYADDDDRIILGLRTDYCWRAFILTDQQAAGLAETLTLLVAATPGAKP